MEKKFAYLLEVPLLEKSLVFERKQEMIKMLNGLRRFLVKGYQVKNGDLNYNEKTKKN